MDTKKKGRLAVPVRVLGVVATSALSLDALVIPGMDSAHTNLVAGNKTTGGIGDSQRTASVGDIASSNPGSIVVPGGSGVKATPSAKQSVMEEKAGTVAPAASKAAADVRPVASAGTTAPAQVKTSTRMAATSVPIIAAQATSRNRSAATAKDKSAEATDEFIIVKDVYSPPNFAAPSTSTVNYVCHNATGATTKEAVFALTPGTPMKVADVSKGTYTVTKQDASIPNTHWCYDIVTSTSPAPSPPSDRSPQPVPQAGQSNKAQQSTDFVIAASRPVGVRVNNFYCLYNDVVSISEEILGNGVKLVPATFEYEYSCADDDDKVLSSGMVKVEPDKKIKINKLGDDRYKVTGKGVSVTGATLAVKIPQVREYQGPPPGQSPQSRLASAAKTALSTAAKKASTSKIASRVSSTKKAVVDVAARSIDFDLPHGPTPCEVKVKTRNIYTMNYTSSFVAKRTEAPADVDFSTRKLAFGYTCEPVGEDEVKDKMEVPGNGTATPLDKQLPMETSYIVTEDEASTQNGDYKVKIAKPQTLTLGERDAIEALAFMNVYTEPAPSPTPPPSKTSSPLEIPTPTPSVTSTPSVMATPLVAPSITPSKPVADPSKPVPPMSNAGRPVPPSAAKPMAPKVKQKVANRGRLLPNTGASVMGMTAVALIATARGTFVLRREGTRSSYESWDRKAAASETTPIEPVKWLGA